MPGDYEEIGERRAGVGLPNRVYAEFGWDRFLGQLVVRRTAVRPFSNQTPMQGRHPTLLDVRIDGAVGL